MKPIGPAVATQIAASGYAPCTATASGAISPACESFFGVASATAAAGERLLVGVVETHGRRETESLLEGLPRLPLRQVSYRGKLLAEFDIDVLRLKVAFGDRQLVQEQCDLVLRSHRLDELIPLLDRRPGATDPEH